MKKLSVNDSTKKEIINELFINKNNEKALKIIASSFFQSNIGTKHNCNRNNKCDCIMLGKMLIKLSQNNTFNFKIIDLVNYFYVSPPNYLPFPLFYPLCVCLLKTFDYISFQAYVTSYLLDRSYLLSQEELQSILELLLINFIYPKEGYERAIEALNKYCFDKRVKKELETKLKCINDNFVSKNDKKINTIINWRNQKRKIVPNIEEFKNKYDNSSFIGKITSICLNKKFILFFFCNFISVLIYKLLYKYFTGKKELFIFKRIKNYIYNLLHLIL